MTSGRTERTEYQLRELPCQDYRRHLQGPQLLGRVLLKTTIEEGIHDSVAATFEERDATEGETNMTNWLHQPAPLMVQITQCQKGHQQRKEERQQQDEEYCREKERHQKDRGRLQEQCQQWDEE